MVKVGGFCEADGECKNTNKEANNCGEYDVYKKIAASLLESASEEELADWNWSPIDKIITMNGDLEQEIVKKVEDTHAGYAEFAELCEELLCLRSR